MSIDQFIRAVKDRPLMYVEKVSIDYIYYLVIGYLGSNLVNKRGYSIDQSFKTYFFQWVLKWVRENIDENYERKSFFWNHIFKEVTNSEEEAVDLFFKLSEKFFEEYYVKE